MSDKTTSFQIFLGLPTDMYAKVLPQGGYMQRRAMNFLINTQLGAGLIND